jgi:imidazolonepropionase-like amidohydrolase
LKCRNPVLAAFLVMVGAVAPLRSQTPQVVAIRAGRLFDSKSGQALADQVVLIEGDKITAVGPAGSVQIPSGAQVIYRRI